MVDGGLKRDTQLPNFFYKWRYPFSKIYPFRVRFPDLLSKFSVPPSTTPIMMGKGLNGEYHTVYGTDSPLSASDCLFPSTFKKTCSV